MPAKPPFTLTVTESAKLSGLSTRTIRRALTLNLLTHKVVKGRYSITLDSLLAYTKSSPTLAKKLEQNGIGYYVKEWKK